MKKVININFQGTVVPIEESAYELLREYIESLRLYFAGEEGRDEIINDIESRISELFQNRLKNEATCITDNDVNLIIDNMGRPKDFEEAWTEGNSSNGKGYTTGSSRSNWQAGQKRLSRDESRKILGGVCSGIGSYLGVDPWLVRILFILSGLGIIAYIILWIFLPSSYSANPASGKKLYRNPDNRVIAGICGGIGSYFNINAWIPRIIFLMPFITFTLKWHNLEVWNFPYFMKLAFSPVTMLVYIILWIVVPEAKTTSEKLQMKGEKVDLGSIKESVIKEMKGVGERVEKLGKDTEQFIKEKGPKMRNEFYHSVNSSGGTIGRIIVTLIKIFAYIILGAVAFSILVVVFSIAIAAIGVFSLKGFIVADGWQNILAWLTLVFFIGVPVIGTITFIIRSITKRRSPNNYFRNIGMGLWVFGWICLFALISFIGRDFKYVNTIKGQSIELNNPAVDYLEITPANTSDFHWMPWLSFKLYSTFGISDDTAWVPNVRLQIIKSDDDQFSVQYFATSNGFSKENANSLASGISYKGYQLDSIFYLDNTIPINTDDKFRNQFVQVVVAVPVNHRIKINKGFRSRSRSDFYLFTRPERVYSQYGTRYEDYSFGREYIMKADGLHELKEPGNRGTTSGEYL